MLDVRPGPDPYVFYKRRGAVDRGRMEEIDENTNCSDEKQNA